MEKDNNEFKLHIGILSSPGIGHIIPVLVLGKRLVAVHNVKVTVFVVTTAGSPTEAQLIKSSDMAENHLNIVEIPPVDISAFLDDNTKMVTQLCLLVRAALPGVRSALRGVNRRLDALIVDLFCTEALPVADELNLPKFVYVPSNAWFVALTVYCPVLDREIAGQYVDWEKPLGIPGCKPVRPEDVVDPMLDRNDQQYREYLGQGRGFTMSDGILMNTWEDVDPGSLKALRENETLRKVVSGPVYAVGPLTRDMEERDGFDGTIMQWLDKQPRESVLYVSFGSGGTLSAEQITELAWGLELSEQRFIWVVRPPSQCGSDKSFFTIGQGADGTPDYLPEGFLTRTHNQGLVVSMWAEQALILRHPSTGGFLSHCGWNSTLESITNGVPMIAWPLYAEQRQNATMLTEELGVAIRPAKLPTKEVVAREEVKTLVKTMVQYKEGKELRKRVQKLRISAEKALSTEGSSYNSMCVALNMIQKRRDLKLHIDA
ncbi:PREDICTED: anthocyanidin 3-O-glucosyltransferase 5-like [Ipomoea nil]|uniref:anthocyanidin 3-O-glucosyltransferase 5-like n=1 Tax=Ipomoea nil TaxID=35883 RepID=UPI0009015DD1|nr:PREDICTED: anthocyanidin 3-O-glucosyltransferase 5-like [Ipomoea nil]